MSESKPRTLPEWAHYIAGLGGQDLRSKARAANNIDFVEDRIAEGYSPDDVETLFILIAQQLKRTDLMLPDAGLYSYRRMSTQAPPVDIVLPALREPAPVAQQGEAPGADSEN